MHTPSAAVTPQTGEGEIFRNIPFPYIKGVRKPAHIVSEHLPRCDEPDCH